MGCWLSFNNLIIGQFMLVVGFFCLVVWILLDLVWKQAAEIYPYGGLG